jgi:hypothetical protein
MSAGRYSLPLMLATKLLERSSLRLISSALSIKNNFSKKIRNKAKEKNDFPEKTVEDLNLLLQKLNEHNMYCKKFR